MCAESCAAELVFDGRHVAVAFPFFHNSFVSGVNGRVVCLYERQTVLRCLPLLFYKFCL